MHRVRCPGKGGLSWRVDEDFFGTGNSRRIVPKGTGFTL